MKFEYWDEWLDFLDHKIDHPEEWQLEPDIRGPTPNILRLAIEYCYVSMLEEHEPPTFIVPDASGGVVIEHKRWCPELQEEFNCLVHFWDDGSTSLFYLDGTKVVFLEDIAEK